jgi:hypothetical protein
MKRIVWGIIVSFFLFSGMAAAFYDGHVYINGIVNTVGSDTMTISHHNYKIDPKCKVVIQYKERGSFHEKPGSLWEVSTGDSVTAKMTGAVLYEIMIERWK